MSKPVLLVTRRLPEAIEARAAKEFDARLNRDDRPCDPAKLPQAAEGASAILCCPAEKLDAATIAALPDTVRVIATFSVGYDHVDIAAAARRGIAVCNTPGVLSRATAECAMLLMLAASRRAGEGERLVRSGGWTGWAPTQLLGVGIAGRRLGIFGMGRIGRELAVMARGFGMEIHYRDIAPLPPGQDMGARYHADDASFLAACDVLSLNAPGGGDTYHWLNAARIAQLPKGAGVVNAARGTLIDDAALIAALKSGHIAYAGLDVFEGEPALNPGYLKLENVALLPHLGSATLQTREAMGHLALDGIAAILAGDQPPNLIREG